MNQRSIIAKQIQEFIFERNDETTRQKLSAQLAKTLNAAFGNCFEVICDETNNPPDLVEKNMLQGVIREKTQKPEEIRYHFKVTSTNVTISNDLN